MMYIDLHRRFYILLMVSFLLVVLLAAYLTQLFVTSIVFSIFFAYLLNPVYHYLSRLTGNKHISSFATVSLASLIILFLTFFVATNLISETSDLVASLEQAHVNNLLFSQSIDNLLTNYFPDFVTPFISSAFSGFFSMILPKLENDISGFITDLPLYLAQLILLVFFTYYFLIDGKGAINWIFDVLPEKLIIDRFINELDKIYYILFRVHFFIALMNGVIASVGFYFIGIPYPLTWGIILGFVSLIPQLGPSGVFILMTLYYLFTGDLNRAIIIFAFGEIFLALLPEYIIRPRIVMIGASIHPVITLLAFTGPAFLIGPAGVIIGPTIYGIALAGYRTMMWLQRI